jgi:hypothetical protein
MFNPAAAFFADIFVGLAVGRVTERFRKRNETVAAFSQQIQQLADVVGFEPVAVQQENLRGFISDKIFG